MAAALRIKKSGEVFRLVDQSDRGRHLAGIGFIVRCYDALVWYGRGKLRRRHYDGILSILYDPMVHAIVETSNDHLLTEEKRRFKERLCRKYHPQKCPSKPSTAFSNNPVSVSRDEGYWLDKLLKLGELALVALSTPGKVNPTELSVLKFDLVSVLDYYSKKRRGTGGESIKEEGRAAVSNAPFSKGVHPPDGETS